MPHPTTTAGTRRSFGACGDRDSQPSRPVADSVHADIGQPDKEFTHARRIGFQQGLPGRLASSTNRFAEPLCRARDHLHDHTQLTLKSEEPLMCPVP